MDKMIARFPEQLEEALVIAKNIQIQKHTAPLRSVFISGLGGSGIGGGFVQDFVRGICKLPVVVSKGYQAPAVLPTAEILKRQSVRLNSC